MPSGKKKSIAKLVQQYKWKHWKGSDTSRGWLTTTDLGTKQETGLQWRVWQKVETEYPELVPTLIALWTNVLGLRQIAYDWRPDAFQHAICPVCASCDPEGYGPVEDPHHLVTCPTLDQYLQAEDEEQRQWMQADKERLTKCGAILSAEQGDLAAPADQENRVEMALKCSVYLARRFNIRNSWETPCSMFRHRMMIELPPPEEIGGNE